MRTMSMSKIFDENTIVTFIKFHRVIQMASCDKIGDYHWLNFSWIINEFQERRFIRLILALDIETRGAMLLSLIFHQQF